MNQSDRFGKEPLGKLLRMQSIPAATGILIMSIYGIVDTIFVGRWVGSMGIAAITVVMPITFLISSIGMAIGVGGASVISRALGSEKHSKAFQAFGNQMGLTLSLAVAFVVLGSFFMDEILAVFGGKGAILEPAREYFGIVLFSVPFLAWAMMSNNVIRSEGFPKVAMFVLVIPAVANLILDPIFIVVFKMGMKGAAWATALSYMASATFTAWFFFFGKSELKIKLTDLIPNLKIISEIASIGSVTLARQGTIAVLSIVLNNSLFSYGGELALSVYGIINRMMMFGNFPVLGITQGFMPIVGYNYGARFYDRVKGIINLSLRSATLIALLIFACIMAFTPQIVRIFTHEEALIQQTVPALRLAFLATPLLAVSLLGGAYFQAIGKVLPALLLTLTKQGIFLIPLILLLPIAFDLTGIWISFPIADVGAAGASFFFLRRETRRLSIG